MILKINDLKFTFELYSEPMKEKDSVVGVDELENQNCGLTYRSKGKVFINKDIAPDQILPTIIHEITHCYIWAYGFNQLDNWKEENICDFISIYGDKILRDSKKVADKLKIKR